MDSGSFHEQEGMVPGELRAGREGRGWTVSEAAERLRISPAQLRALEEGRYTDLPGPTFVRGYLKNYARLLGMDPELVLQAYARMGGDGGRQPTQPVLPPTEGPLLDYSRRILFISAVVVLLLIALAWWLWGGSREGTSGTGNVSHSTATAAAGSVPRPVALSAPVISVPESAARVVLVHPHAALRSSGTAMAVSAMTVSARQLSGLEFRFSGKCWVQVRDATGRILLSGLGKAGEEMQAGQGTPPYQVLVGKASAVHIYYEGQAVSLPGNPLGVARLELGSPVSGAAPGMTSKNGAGPVELTASGLSIQHRSQGSPVTPTLSSPFSGHGPETPVPAGTAASPGLISTPTASEVSHEP